MAVPTRFICLSRDASMIDVAGPAFDDLAESDQSSFTRRQLGTVCEGRTLSLLLYDFEASGPRFSHHPTMTGR